MFAARDRYPRFLSALHERTARRVPMVTGAIEVALNDVHLDELRRRAAALDDTRLLDRGDVAAIEPALSPVAGALHHPRDGAVDSAALLAALDDVIRRHDLITVVEAIVISISDATSALPTVTLSDHSKHRAPHVILATGAWAGALDGAPRALPVRPMKGEIAIAGIDRIVQRVIFGAGGYLVPRGDQLVVGATAQDTGFDARSTDAALTELSDTARTLLRDWPFVPAGFVERTAGLRPMTPDGYPILGCEPDAPGLLYACGYSRNGVLVSPLAADCLSALIVGEDPGFDLTPFSATRFGG